ncbi:MAG: four helix bundle protein [Crocinitomicaceae bacterium]|nr:four helix bundle protein [Crocinitomicaceae bacterium]
MHKFREFQFWNRSKQLCIEIYSSTKDFPKTEQFGLTNQIRRSAVSIPSNIAEGASRTSKKDFSRFLEIAIGSAHELETQLEIAHGVGYLPKEKFEFLHAEVKAIILMTSRYKALVKK